MRFDIADLTLFIHIAESGSITGGAQRSHLALASASERVKNMEFRAGVSLLTRRPRGIGLTPAGDILLRHARRIVGEHDRLCAGLTAFAAGYGGTQRIYANTSAQAGCCPAALRPGCPRIRGRCLRWRRSPAPRR
ncbi:LysR family transcriptional regulator [Pluralibacter gergoviae]|uniref:LysR family transcriptional regulator n=1 Tax=Pluralibacter gergoviae TaxID=61647 RepID=UPI001F283B82|nr:LysR family transcriptional regulator [Pluralibacter gergoviae]